MMDKISFVIPCYHSELTIDAVIQEISAVMKPLNYQYEIVLIDDGSPDRTRDAIAALCHAEKHIKGIVLARNFGQHNAVMAGYSRASGNCIITLDADGQSPVDAVPELINMLIEKGFDVVYGVCKQAKSGLLRRLGSRLNGMMLHKLYGRPKDMRVISFCIMTRSVMMEMLKYKGPKPYLAGLRHRAAKNIGYLRVEHRRREVGKSGYTAKKLIDLWISGLRLGLGGKAAWQGVPDKPQYVIEEIINDT
jgi:undecaprenyl-phosphate 4-deoxy-4-formamido-L-arabinose transferase